VYTEHDAKASPHEQHSQRCIERRSGDCVPSAHISAHFATARAAGCRATRIRRAFLDFASVGILSFSLLALPRDRRGRGLRTARGERSRPWRLSFVSGTIYGATAKLAGSASNLGPQPAQHNQ
jgi:hypothetical protein